jgi:hypothetical protein
MPRELQVAFPGGRCTMQRAGATGPHNILFPQRYSRPCRGTHAQAQPLLPEGINAKSAQEGTAAGVLEVASATTCCVLPRLGQTLPVLGRFLGVHLGFTPPAMHYTGIRRSEAGGAKRGNAGNRLARPSESSAYSAPNLRTSSGNSGWKTTLIRGQHDIVVLSGLPLGRWRRPRSAECPRQSPRSKPRVLPRFPPDDEPTPVALPVAIRAQGLINLPQP